MTHFTLKDMAKGLRLQRPKVGVLILQSVDIHDRPGSNQWHHTPDVSGAVETDRGIEATLIQIAGKVAR